MIFVLCQSLALTVMKAHFSFMSGFDFFFKQKTAYEIHSGDWSSDVCSSDLPRQCNPLRAMH